MTKTPTTAAHKDALIAEAATHGLTITRTSKDFFLGEGEDRQRVTPTEIYRLIEDAKTAEAERVEALAAADELREQEEAEAPVEALEAPAAEVEGASPVQPAEAPEAPTTPAPAPAAEKAAKVVIKWGPPCGGDLAALPAATHDEGRNPIVHLDFTPSVTYKSKEEAGAAGRRSGKAGWMAGLAQDAAGTQFWIVAALNAEGQLELDGRAVQLELLTGKEADACRQKVKGQRNQAKAQWVARRLKDLRTRPWSSISSGAASFQRLRDLDPSFTP